MIQSITTINHPCFNELVFLFEAYRQFYHQPTDIQGAKTFLEERVNNQDSMIFIYQDAQNALGFMQLYTLFSSTRMKKLWLLNDLFVHESYRGKAIGKQLLEKAKKLCKETNACGILLETEKNNLSANALYTNTQFLLDKDHHYYFWEYYK